MNRRSERYARHALTWRAVGYTPLTETEYNYPVETRAAWLLYANFDTALWTPELLRAIERVEHAIAMNAPRYHQLLWEIKSGEWNP